MEISSPLEPKALKRHLRGVKAVVAVAELLEPAEKTAPLPERHPEFRGKFSAGQFEILAPDRPPNPLPQNNPDGATNKEDRAKITRGRGEGSI